MSIQPGRARSELIERLYSAVGDPRALGETIAGVARNLNADAAAAQHYDLRRKRGADAVGFLLLDEPFLRRYLDYYSAVNVWMLNSRGTVHPGRILLSHEMYPDNRLEDTEWYADCLRPEGLFHSCGVVLGVIDGVSTSMTFLRGKAAGRFNAGEARALRCLAPHLRRVFALHRQFLAASIRTGDARQVLDCLPVGVIIVDGRMAIDCANRKGREILERKEGLEVQADRLVAPPAHDRALRALVATALATPPGTPAVLRVLRPDGQRSLEVSAVPISAAPSFWGPGQARAAVFVSDKQGEGTMPAESLRAIYQLTPAEARLAALLAGGEDLGTAAGRLDVSLNTVRTQLRVIFEKTDTHRQSELVHSLLTSPARFRHPAE